MKKHITPVMTHCTITCSTTAQVDTQQYTALQEKLLSDALIWGLPISHPAETPTGREAHYHCAQTNVTYGLPDGDGVGLKV